MGNKAKRVTLDPFEGMNISHRMSLSAYLLDAIVISGIWGLRQCAVGKSCAGSPV
jgi:hypothetical protein